MRIAVQMDDWSRIRWATDSTLLLMREAWSRGADLVVYQPANLCLAGGSETTPHHCTVQARGQKIRFCPEQGDGPDSLDKDPEHLWSLEECDVVLVRQDPPFDMAYLSATWILGHLPAKVRVINSPAALQGYPEKLLPLHWPDLCPPTLITADTSALKDFHRTHGHVVLKPLYGHGGYGVTSFGPCDANLEVVAGLMLDHTRTPVVIQKFMPEVTAGDRRMFFVHGEWVGGFSRRPPEGQIRTNTVLGGTIVPVAFSEHEKNIARRLGPFFRDQGMALVGLDMIGPFITEINITSPTGLVGLAQTCGVDAAALFWDGLGLPRKTGAR